MTLCYARFDQKQRRLSFVDCGHTKTLHITPGTGELRTLEGDSMPLGISEREVYTQVTVPFAPGDLFCFYSDGVTEARNEAGELFGFDRLAETIRANRRLTSGELVESVRRAVVAFASGAAFPDDLTCVIVQIDEGEEEMTGREATALPSPRFPVSPSPPERSEAIRAHGALEVSSVLTELARIRAFVRAFCRDAPPAGLTQEPLNALELAVNEAASNIMRHAYEGRTDQRIQVEADAFDDRIVICLYNTGKPFDPASSRPPSFDGSREGGFGVYMIASSLDEVQYYRDERGRNCICMTKRRT
jgi:anti-sigma regulatory factor (Ser/Thr protein kinase)